MFLWVSCVLAILITAGMFWLFLQNHMARVSGRVVKFSWHLLKHFCWWMCTLLYFCANWASWICDKFDLFGLYRPILILVDQTWSNLVGGSTSPRGHPLCPLWPGNLRPLLLLLVVFNEILMQWIFFKNVLAPQIQPIPIPHLFNS